MFLSPFWCLQWQDLWETWCFHGVLIGLVWQKAYPVLSEGGGGFCSEGLYHAVSSAILFCHLVCCVFVGFVSFSFEWRLEEEWFVGLPATRSLQQTYLQRALPSKPLNSLITFALKAVVMADLMVVCFKFTHSLHVWPHLAVTNKQKGKILSWVSRSCRPELWMHILTAVSSLHEQRDTLSTNT